MPLSEIESQAVAVEVLQRAVSSGRVASSYLFEGPSGVGKQRAALGLAEALICPQKPGEGCGTCDTCRRLRAGSHPDLRVFPPRDEGNRNIAVEFLRNEILPVAQYAPFEAAASVLVFPEADVSFPQVHPESANALLKTLEEPRQNVHFVLLSERPERLLPTILSRCQNVRFGRLSSAVVERILADAGVDAAARAPAVALADGRADRALALAASGAADELLEEALRIDAAIDAGKPGTLIGVGETLARSDDLPLALETLTTYYRDVAAAGLGLGDDALRFRHRADSIRERAARLPASRAAARVELIMRAADTFERNANRQTSLDALLFRLRAT